MIVELGNVGTYLGEKSWWMSYVARTGHKSRAFMKGSFDQNLI
jgi:hypothetical protein